jgi:hypothetical protein
MVVVTVLIVAVAIGTRDVPTLEGFTVVNDIEKIVPPEKVREHREQEPGLGADTEVADGSGGGPGRIDETVC